MQITGGERLITHDSDDITALLGGIEMRQCPCGTGLSSPTEKAFCGEENSAAGPSCHHSRDQSPGYAPPLPLPPHPHHQLHHMNLSQEQLLAHPHLYLTSTPHLLHRDIGV
ncbi:hypothetical protein BaRGS_00017077 [Batillaria attramentaria]|uniref:Uncharacterized protein n=1 Tax=Batillaria attramentaria TaxID=370345 RepID=A0ABD0KWL8_9CAEN